MKLLGALVLVMGMLGGLHQPFGIARADETPATEEKKEVSRVSHGTNGEVIVTLDRETQQRIWLVISVLADTNLPPAIKGYGRVLDPTPLIQFVADLAPAEVTAEASRKEFERLRLLRTQENASDRALQAAEAQALRDKLFAGSLRAKLLLNWGKTLAESDKLPELTKELTALNAAVVRVDLPAGERLPGTPTGARLTGLNAGAKPIAGEFLGPATSTDLQFQGQGFLFLVRTNAPTAGAALTALIQIDAAPLSGLLIPSDAIIRHAGKGWVYVKTGEDKFTRREATLGRPEGPSYFVTGGFAAGDEVVTTGAQLLLSEELKGQGEEE